MDQPTNTTPTPVQCSGCQKVSTATGDKWQCDACQMENQTAETAVAPEVAQAAVDAAAAAAGATPAQPTTTEGVPSTTV